MNILILGGTAFLGRHLVTAALERGHTLTLFHRGNRNPFPELENIIGDRTKDLEKLAGREWDTVIDTSGYVPRVVGMSARALKDSVKRYCFISTISVYSNYPESHGENAPLAQLETDTEEITGATYGALKVLCEQAVTREYGDRALNLRPGLIVGAYDPSDRFTYWVDRVARDGEVLAPGEPSKTVQFIDALDLARFTIRALENELSGEYNLNGQPIPMQDVLETIRAVSGSDANFTWASEEFLQTQNVKPWMGEDSLPLWIPGDTGETIIDKALSAGLDFRDLHDVIRETLEFAKARENHAWRSGITLEREKSLLESWRTRQ
jgi:2'-hydroxyisoflavone reductase